MAKKEELSLDNLSKTIEKGFGEKLEFEQTKSGDIAVTVPREKLLAFCQFVKKSKKLNCNYLRCLFGVDGKDYIGVVYHVCSITRTPGFLIKVRLPRRKLVVPSVTSVWEAADWYERETAEMFGITFEGHPNPENILLADDFEGHPLRKEFLLPDEREKRTKRAKSS